MQDKILIKKNENIEMFLLNANYAHPQYNGVKADVPLKNLRIGYSLHTYL